MTTQASMRPHSVIVPCPKCAVPLNQVSDVLVQCDNEDCDDFGKELLLELPKFDVNLTEVV